MSEKDINRVPTQEELMKLWNTCVKFVKYVRIGCEEDVYQTDRVIEGGYDFIDDVSQITGYVPYEEEESYQFRNTN